VKKGKERKISKLRPNEHFTTIYKNFVFPVTKNCDIGGTDEAWTHEFFQRASIFFGDEICDVLLCKVARTFMMPGFYRSSTGGNVKRNRWVLEGVYVYVRFDSTQSHIEVQLNTEKIDEWFILKPSQYKVIAKYLEEIC